MSIRKKKKKKKALSLQIGWLRVKYKMMSDLYELLLISLT